MSKDILPEEFYEKFPASAVKIRLGRIWDQILKFWGSQEGIEYLNSLLVVEEDRSRQGFDSQAMSELLFLEKSMSRNFQNFGLQHTIPAMILRMMTNQSRFFDTGTKGWIETNKQG